MIPRFGALLTGVGTFLFCLLLWASNSPAENLVKRPFSLTDKESAWLKAHPSIRIGVDAEYAPYSFRDPEGNYRGIAMEFTRYLSEKLGIQMHG
jgi:ABC-type amino acid transport substrate-binding protein